MNAHLLQVDAPALAAALFAALACALLGNFLVLRRQSLMSDAISHSVLPGVVLAFMMTGARTSLAMFAGAAVAALVSVALVQLVRSRARLESGAAMGVVFSIMFAAGVVLIEQGAARNVDLDADCVLYGQLEHILWLAASSPGALLDAAVWRELPRQVSTLAGVFAVSGIAVALFWKELKISSFDPQLASALGFSARAIDTGLMFFVGVVAVAAFEAVGSILVIAMFICPAAAARALTERLGAQVALSLVFAALAAISGYILAAFGPGWAGIDASLSASGMIATMSGVILALAALSRRQPSRRRGLEPSLAKA